MRFVPLLVFMAIALNDGCPGYVEQAKYDAVVQQLQGAKKQLEGANSKLTACEAQPKHHYELKSQGLRTWRFDSSTGQTCIQLTSDYDWKKPDTMRQSCPYVDFIENGGTYQQAECVYNNKCDLPAPSNASQQ